MGRHPGNGGGPPEGQRRHRLKLLLPVTRLLGERERMMEAKAALLPSWLLWHPFTKLPAKPPEG
jgi:hypothetical protein